MNSKHSPSHDGFDPEDDLDERPPSRSMLKRASLALHQAERWRAELIADDKDAVTRWVADFPDTDVQQLRTLIRNARKDAALEPEKRSGRAYRELFQFIKRTMEAHDKGDASPDQGTNT